MSDTTTQTKPLRQHRREALYSINELARLSGVSHMTIKSAENGTRTPQPATMRKLSAVLDVEPLEVAEFAAAIKGGGR